MKTALMYSGVVLFLLSGCLFAGNMLLGTLTSLHVSVRTDENEVVTNADVEVKFELISGEPVLRKGKTDANGNFNARSFSDGIITGYVSRDDFYASPIKCKFQIFKSGLKKGEPILIHPTSKQQVEVVLRKIKNPIPMHCPKGWADLTFPSNNTYFAYDFKKANFVAPYGNGEIADCKIALFYDSNRDYGHDNYPKLEIEFVGEGSGVYCVDQAVKDWRHNGAFLSPYNADTNAVYETKISFQHARGKEVYDEGVKADKCMIFRTRTVMDETGKIVKANYGKIYGPVDFISRGVFTIRSYFNPTPNDTNLECSGKNLNADARWPLSVEP